MSYPKYPYIKSKNFCANPIIKYGIPKFADSRLNKSVIGTPDHEKFWDEQLYYIFHGYQTGGIFIPGRYYYYANFKLFDTVYGPRHADICDLHLELAYIIDHVKGLDGSPVQNFIGPKKRRAGLTEAFTTMDIDYGYRFMPGYQAGVAAGISTYYEDFMKKWSNHDNRIVPELRVRHKGTDSITACYDLIDDSGKREEGTFNTIHVATTQQNANIFKGKFFHDVVAEEGMEFKNLKTFFNATKASLMFGSVQKGSFWTWGTGANKSSFAEDFKDMWHHPEAYNMFRFFIPGPRFYFPYYGGATDEMGKVVEKIPNLIKSHKPHETLGMEDEAAATVVIKQIREELLKTGQIEKYIEECFDNPLELADVFKIASSNKFDIEVLNKVGFEIESGRKKYAKYKLEYKKNSTGERLMPLQVEAIPAKATDKDSECVLITEDGHPRLGFQNLYCGGLDSYDQDQSKVSKSLGAMLVMIRTHSLQSVDSMKPVCFIRTRPARKELFYDMCLKVAIYYNIVGGVLVDVAKPLVIEYFKTHGCSKYLARRPKKFESANSEQSHDYGVSLNLYSRPAMISLMQTYVLDHGHKIEYIKLIDELKIYDESAKDSDNDLADALGIALMQNVSNTIDAREVSDKDRMSKYLLNDPNEEAPRLKTIEQDHDGFGR